MLTSTTSNACADRPNTNLAADVDVALTLLEQQGARAAADFLQARGAGFGVICRVLVELDRRRSGPVGRHAEVTHRGA